MAQKPDSPEKARTIEVTSQDGRPPRIDDKQFWEIYSEECGSTRRTAERTGYSQRTVRHRVLQLREAFGFKVQQPEVDDAGKLESLVAAIPIQGPGGARLKEASARLWGIGAKDELTQQIVRRGLHSTGARYVMDKPPLDVEPRESPLRAYKPIVAKGILCEDVERVFIIGDVQIGFWCMIDPKRPKHPYLDPFHDEAALDVQMKALALFRPHRLIIIGDWVDYQQLSPFRQEPEFERTMQASIQEAYDLMRKVRDTVGDDCKIDFIPGNHEGRMQKTIVNNARGLYELIRPGEKYSIYSIQSLMKMEQLGIECAAEWPRGEVWLRKRKGQVAGLVATHADTVLKADSVHGHRMKPVFIPTVDYDDGGSIVYKRMCVSGTARYATLKAANSRITPSQTPGNLVRPPSVQSFGTVQIERRTGMRTFGLHLYDHDGSVRFLGRRITSDVKR